MRDVAEGGGLQRTGVAEPITLVSVVREPISLLLRFVAWHRRQGVGQFLLYFDDPDDPAIEVVAGESDVTCIRCTAAFWASVRRTPEDRFVKRQIAALTHGFRQVRSGWVAVADGDELFHVPDGGLRAAVAQVPPDVPVLRVLPAEIVQTEASGLHFRLPVAARVAGRIYGDAAFLVRRNGGLVGHVQGKSLTRAGTELSMMRQHFPVARDWSRLPERRAGPAEGAYLLHFFDRGYDSWRTKLAWRLGAWGFAPDLADRLRPLVEAQEAGGEGAGGADAALRALYDALHRCDSGRLQRLAQAGALLVVEDDPMEMVRQDFPAFAGRTEP